MRKLCRDKLMLAYNYKPTICIDGWYCSEKLDGMRAYWDGAGVLWSRLGNPIAAPAWFLGRFPAGVPLDGELYTGRNNRQELMSIVKRHKPDDRWINVNFMVFDSPREDIIKPYRLVYNDLKHYENRTIIRVFQKPIIKKDLYDELEQVTNCGGEGLMLRNPNSIYQPKRSLNLLKIKKLSDSEAKIIGFSPGKGKHEGRIGSLIVAWKGHTLKLSGMTDKERDYKHFYIGQTICFRYRGLSKYGIPQEARYWRTHEQDGVCSEVLKKVQ